MKVIEIVKFPDRKHKAICVYESSETNPVRHVIGYINHNEDLFKQALLDTTYVIYTKTQDTEEERIEEEANKYAKGFSNS